MGPVSQRHSAITYGPFYSVLQCFDVDSGLQNGYSRTESDNPGLKYEAS